MNDDDCFGQLKVGTKIRKKTAGDKWTIRRDIPNIPTGQQVVKAWMTIKLNWEDDDPGIIQKIVDQTDVPGTGQVEVAGTSGKATVRFDLMPSETVLLEPWKEYFYDIQVKTDLDVIDTPDDGTIIANPQITRATS